VVTQSLTILSLFIVLTGLSPFAAAKQQLADVPVTIYGKEDGLCSAEVYRIHQSQDGFLWFSTEGGLCRFDGQQFQAYEHDPADDNSPSDGLIYQMLEDAEGNFLLRFHNGKLDYFDRKAERFTHLYQSENGKVFVLPEQLPPQKNNRILIAIDKLYAYDFASRKLEVLRETVPDDIATDNYYSSSTFSFENGEFLIFTPFNGKFHWLDANGQLLHSETRRHLFSGVNFYPLDENRLLLCGLTPALIEGHSVTPLLKDNPLYNGKQSAYNYLCWRDKRHIYYWSRSHKLIFDGSNGQLLDKAWPIADLSFDRVVGNPLATQENLFVPTIDGLLRIDRNTQQRQLIVANKDNPSFRLDVKLLEDHEGNVWWTIGGRGVARWSPSGQPFSHQKAWPEGNAPSEHIRNFYRDDKHHRLWVGTDNDGLYWQDLQSQQWHHAPLPGSLLINHALRNSVRSIISAGSDGSVFIGTERHGVLHYSPSTKAFTPVSFPEDMSRPAHLSLHSMRLLLDDGDTFWGVSNALFRFDKKSRRALEYSWPNNEFAARPIKALIKTRNGDIWVGNHGNGVFRYSPHNDRWHNVPQGKAENMLNNGNVFALWEDPAGLIWVGTWGGAIDIIDPTQGVIRRIDSSQGLSDNTVFGLLDDSLGHVWVSTLNGLNRIHWCDLRQTRCQPQIKTFWPENGLHGPEFDSESAYRAEDGTLYFGGLGGYTYFQPRAVIDNSTPPEMQLTGLTVGGVDPRHNPILKSELTLTDKGLQLTLPYDAPQINLQVLPLSFAAPEQNKVRYRFADEPWQYADGDKVIRLQRLSYGRHRITIEGSNNSGVWSKQPFVADITLLPPWWRSNLALAMYSLCLIILVATIFWVRQRRILLWNQQLEAQVAERTEALRIAGEQLKKNLQEKQQLFENLTHELKTPLTIILAEIENLLEKASPQDRKPSIGHDERDALQRIDERAHYLLNLINQLLNAARLNAKVYDYEKVDVNRETQRIIENFRAPLSKRNIKIRLLTEVYGDEVVLIGNTLDIVLGNLLQNCVKYAATDNTITLSLQKEGAIIRWRLQDPKTQLNNIQQLTERFGRANNDTQGHGLGLSIVVDYVEAHHGEFRIEQDEGVCFEFTLRAFDDDVLSVSNGNSRTSIPSENPEHQSDDSRPTSADQPDDEQSQAMTLLCVEDEPDIVQILKRTFSPYYQVLCATDGQQGLQMAQESMPDLIISDVMMPGMDGVELCQAIKSDPTLTHIPVILLTAKDDFESEQKGLKAQADDYLAKPFSPKLIKLKVDNRMATLRALKEKIRQQWQQATEAIGDIDRDEPFAQTESSPFVSDLLDILSRTYSDSRFGVTELAEALQMHPKSLNRRCRSLLQRLPAQVIREYRVAQAKKRLRRGEKLASVALACGYSDHSHFSRAFKKETGLTPRQWKAQNTRAKSNTA